jgi:aminoglycoside 3-N-acetyltransferase
MYTKQDLLNHLKKIGINPSGTLKVHLSYKAIGEVEGRGDTVLDALAEYMAGGLLVLPSHTWDRGTVSDKNPVMDVLHTKSCVGALTEVFRRRPGVFRSLHPSHSVAALGVDAEGFVSGEEHIHSPCGAGGAYYKLWERNAQILLIGVNFTCNTFIHGCEEWDGAEGSLSTEKRDRYVINHQGKRLYTPQYYHTATSETFVKLETPAMMKGILSMGRFGDANTRLISAVDLREMTAGFLKADAKYLLRY